MKIKDEIHYLWRAVDHQNEVLDAIVTMRKNKLAAQKILKSLRSPTVIVTV